MMPLLSLLAVAGIFVVVLALVIKNLLYICAPNEVLIFSGGQSPSAIATPRSDSLTQMT